MSVTNDALYQRAVSVIPGGVNSPVRAFGSVDANPYFVARGDGPYVWDVEGHQYIDLVQSYGAIILGHAHSRVVEAVAAAAQLGTSFGAPTLGEVRLAEAIAQRVPSVEKVRMVSSGTEAVMSAIRVARGATGRSRIVKFAGCYHGHSDGLLVAGGSGVATLGLPGSAGVTVNQVSDTTVVSFNLVPNLDDDVAAVIIEPVAANMGLVAPNPGFLEGVRAECDRVGALLVFDEVITGFRLGPDGAQGRYGVQADLTCFGKVIGGGLPVGAFGGRKDLMDLLAPSGPVYQAGTLSGNPLATAAGLAVLDELTPTSYAELTTRVGRFADQLERVLRTSGLEVRVPTVGSLFGIYCGGDLPIDFDGAARSDSSVYATLFQEFLVRGVALAPGVFEIAFVGLSHDDVILDRVLNVANEVAGVIQGRQ